MTDDIRARAIEAACVEFTRGDMPSWRRWDEDERNETREAMARAIAAYEGAMWRPIEEAPIEARRASPPMLLLCPGVTSWNRYNNASDMIVGAWNGVMWESDIGDVDQGYESSGAYFEREALHPTRFRPLPLPPEDEA